jgi:hypothetical protein
MTDTAELGPAALMDESPDVVSYEQTRIDQVMKAAGISPDMLNAMDKAALAAALAFDNQLFEEGNFMSALRGSGNFRDQLRFTAEERAEIEGRAEYSRDEVEAEMTQMGGELFSRVMRMRKFLGGKAPLSPSVSDHAFEGAMNIGFMGKLTGISLGDVAGEISAGLPSDKVLGIQQSWEDLPPLGKFKPSTN